MKPTQTNLQSQTYQAYQAKPTKLIKLPNPIYQTQYTKPNIPNPIYQTNSIAKLNSSRLV